MSAVHLVLVGLMGSGKSSVGRRVAETSHRSFVDTDHRIEKIAGLSIRDIFSNHGESEFRRMESDVLRDVLSSATPTVVATGGGVVLSEVNRDLLGGHHVIWLRATIDTLATRLVHTASRRPLLDGDVRERLLALERDRSNLYRVVSSRIVDVDDLEVDEVASLVLAAEARS